MNMTVIDFFGKVQVFLKVEDTSIDNNVFRLHYKATVVMLIVLSLVITSKQHLGDPIHCQARGKLIAKEVLNSYCWIYSTFTVTKHFGDTFNNGRSPAHPGVGPYRKNEDNVVYNKYYQWVPLILLFQALLFYTPCYLWKGWEGGQLSMLASDLRTPLPNEKWSPDRKKRILEYFSSSYPNINNFYALKFTFCEILNFSNVIGQMFLLNRFLDGEFTSYGSKIIEFIQNTNPEGRVDPMAERFPKVTKCNFKTYGPSGSMQNIDAICILPLNVMNEKIFIFLWFWFIILAILSGLVILYHVALFVVPRLRISFLLAQSRFVPRSKVEVLVRRHSAGDWFFLYQLGKNLNQAIFREILLDLAKKSEAASETGKVVPV